MAYVGMGVIAGVIAVIWRAGSPFTHPKPWLVLTPIGAHSYSLALGITLGLLIVIVTRACVSRFEWARRLHQELRPLAHGITSTGIIVLAALSALGEELLFRGLLEPWLGLVPQALLFGLLHQVRGASRWVWMAWATAVGLVFGAMFELTGSLFGPIAAHAVVNALNLSYLKSHDPEPRRRLLGGLLGQRG
jgi:membrane protease YdiL (CAAX protease family)